MRSFRLGSETDAKTLSCTYDKEILTIKLQVHSALGDDYIRNLTSPFDDDLVKGPHNDTTGGIPQIIPTDRKTSEVVKDTSVFPLLKARGVRIKTLSGLYLRACERTGTVSVVNNAGSGELWLAERINGPTKYAFRSFYGKYLTACVCDEGMRADRDIALAWEVWTIQKLNDGTMTFISERNEYLGFVEVNGLLCATHVMPNEHSKWIIEEIDNFNDSVI